MRFGILSDAHGNVEAFELALRILDAAKVDAIYFLGDAVGYIPDKGVVSILRDRDIRSLRGNHDDMLLRQSAKTDQDVAYRHRETLAALTDAEREFMRRLPLTLTFRESSGTVLFVHGSPRNPLAGYIYPDSSLEDLATVDADIVVMGHTHHPFVRSYGGKLFVNVGSCGLPRGEDLRGSACVLDLQDRSARILRFDISGPCRRVLSCYSLAPPVTELLERCSNYDGKNS